MMNPEKMLGSTLDPVDKIVGKNPVSLSNFKIERDVVPNKPKSGTITLKFDYTRD